MGVETTQLLINSTLLHHFALLMDMVFVLRISRLQTRRGILLKVNIHMAMKLSHVFHPLAVLRIRTHTKCQDDEVIP